MSLSQTSSTSTEPHCGSPGNRRGGEKHVLSGSKYDVQLVVHGAPNAEQTVMFSISDAPASHCTAAARDRA